MSTSVYVYAGQRLGTKGKLLFKYLDESTGEEHVFSEALKKGAPIGARLQVVSDEERNGVLTGGANRPVFLDVLPNDDGRLAGWIARTEEAKTRDAEERAVKKAAQNAPGFGDLTLKQIREQIHASSFTERKRDLITAVWTFLSS